MIKKGKYCIDGLMAVFMILLLGRSFTGNTNHELIGISMISLFALHLILNIRWFANLKKIIHNSGNSLLNVLWLIINGLLLIDMVLLCVSAVITSEEVFSFLKIGYSRPWRFVHQAAAYAGYILMSVHLGMHWQMIMSSVSKSGRLKKTGKWRGRLLRCAVVFLIVGGISASFRREIGGKFTYYMEGREKREEVEEDYIGNLFFDYICISAIYVASAHYSIKLMNKVTYRQRKPRKGG